MLKINNLTKIFGDKRYILIREKSMDLSDIMAQVRQQLLNAAVEYCSLTREKSTLTESLLRIILLHASRRLHIFRIILICTIS